MEKLPEKKQLAGIEVPLHGYSMSLKSDLLFQSDKYIMTKLYSKALNKNGGIMPDLFVINRFYPQYLRWFTNKMTPNETFTERYGVPFYMYHNGVKVLVDPTNKTDMFGFEEVFTKRAYSNWEILSNHMDNSYSSDPWITHDMSTSILFEGEYITAFGLVTYNAVKGKFRMGKPLAFISGGIMNVVKYLKSRV